MTPLRPEVRRFAEMMEQMLVENGHKPSLNISSLRYLLGVATQNLLRALEKGASDAVARHAVSLALWAMFIASNCGGLAGTEKT